MILLIGMPSDSLLVHVVRNSDLLLNSIPHDFFSVIYGVIVDDYVIT